MSYKEIWLPFKIDSFVNVRNEDGTYHAHCLISENDLIKMKNEGITPIEDYKDIPEVYKNDGKPRHVFVGWDPADASNISSVAEKDDKIK